MMLDTLPKVLDPLPGGSNLVNAVDYVVNWARSNSLWPLVFGTSCCAIEMMATGASHQDWARFGVEVARASPRQADLIILAGTIVEKMAPRLITLYDQMPAPKYVIAMGACTISGGPFYYDSYYAIKGADRLIPVDVYIPGCPPRPEALLFGIMQLQELIKNESIRKPRIPPAINASTPIDTLSDAENKWEEQEKVKQAGLSEARERFKSENPDFKAYVHKRLTPEKFEEVPRQVKIGLGLKKSELYDKISQGFSDLKVYGLETVTPEVLDEKGSDTFLELEVDKDRYLSLINFLRNKAEFHFDYLIQITAIDWKDRFELVVQLLSSNHKHKIGIRCSISRETAEIETLSQLYAGANWHEREVYDFFGIRFIGHPDLRRLFLTEDFPGYPLRKDFEDEKRIVKRPY